ncbi:hypothetical protein E1H99_12140 [Enterococcus hirae]|nr:hypothetical protein E1H99_12140 [Enterococcus hirae]
MFESLEKKHYTLDEMIEWLIDTNLFFYEELIFLPSLDQFKNSLATTARYSSFEKEDLDALLTDHRLVARTIDGEFLFANEETVCLFPHSHMKEDLLYFNGTFSDLLIRYANSSKSIADFFY